jgi:hypothetical protein
MGADIVFLLAGCGFVVTTAGFAVAWVGARGRAGRAEATLAELRRASGGGGSHLESAIQDVALELERLAEGQRFVARILTERPEISRSSSGRLPARVDTPH